MGRSIHESNIPAIEDDLQSVLRDMTLEDFRGSEAVARLPETLLTRINITARQTEQFTQMWLKKTVDTVIKPGR